MGATAQPLKPTAGRVRVTSWSLDNKIITDRDYALADRINTFITAETSFIVGGINIYTIAKRTPT